MTALENQPPNTVHIDLNNVKGCPEHCAAMTRSWEEAREEFRRLVRERMKTMSPAQIAEEIGIARPTLVRHLKGRAGEPYGRTRELIDEWIRRTKGNIVKESHAQYAERADRSEREARPEEELLAYFLEHAEQMATFMRTSMEGLGPEDRRKVALAILNGFKRLAIEQGMKIPQEIYDLERKFVAE